MDLLQIQNNTTSVYTTIDVIQYSVKYNKMWGSSVKNLRGSTRATLIGILPVINASTMPLYQTDLQTATFLLNQGYASVKFYDTDSGTIKTEQYTISDVNTEMIRKDNTWYNEISFVLTPVDVREFVS